jgi:exodeoxyribonuclease V alpha subunit
MLMEFELANLNNALLLHLKNKYQVEEESSLYNAAKMLLQKLWQGSVCVSLKEMEKEISNFDKKCLDNANAISKGKEVRPLIFDGENLYIQRYFIYQCRILKKINELQNEQKLHIITGGPGTGKTTSLAKILTEKLNENLEQKILLAAPTGKAAFRMNEALKNSIIYDAEKPHTYWLKNTNPNIIENLKNLESKTLHRLLGYLHLSVNFKHTAENPLDAKLVAIDECSMVDLPMMSKLLEAIPCDCDLYLLGDKNQLASVEAGSVFADICRKFEKDKNVYYGLTENHRAKNAPGIVALSEQILNSSETSYIENFENSNVSHCEQLSIKNLFSEYKDLCEASTGEKALDFLKNFQILCAIKKGKSGTENINRELLSLAKNANFTPIMITENNYQQNLFNGDIGVKNKETAYFSSGAFPMLTLPKHEDAFAITIHKSQGSEYNRIAVVYPNAKPEEGEQSIFTRELLYTAITRAKDKCIIYGSFDVLKNSCKEGINRASGIK